MAIFRAMRDESRISEMRIPMSKPFSTKSNGRKVKSPRMSDTRIVGFTFVKAITASVSTVVPKDFGAWTLIVPLGAMRSGVIEPSRDSISLRMRSHFAR